MAIAKGLVGIKFGKVEVFSDNNEGIVEVHRVFKSVLKEFGYPESDVEFDDVDEEDELTNEGEKQEKKQEFAPWDKNSLSEKLSEEEQEEENLWKKNQVNKNE